jgi:hypothetical protein
VFPELCPVNSLHDEGRVRFGISRGGMHYVSKLIQEHDFIFGYELGKRTLESLGKIFLPSDTEQCPLSREDMFQDCPWMPEPQIDPNPIYTAYSYSYIW